MLLWGPPGTGKSTAFDCACGELVKLQREGDDDFKMPAFFEVTETTFKDCYLGETEKNIEVRTSKGELPIATFHKIYKRPKPNHAQNFFNMMRKTVACNVSVVVFLDEVTGEGKSNK